jgi:hypothetical protein
MASGGVANARLVWRPILLQTWPALGRHLDDISLTLELVAPFVLTHASVQQFRHGRDDIAMQPDLEPRLIWNRSCQKQTLATATSRDRGCSLSVKAGIDEAAQELRERTNVLAHARCFESGHVIVSSL